MRYISADWIFPINSDPVSNGILVVKDNGEIETVLDPAATTDLPAEIEKHEGLICPGFVNTHCHLELSHLRGQITRHTGFAGFGKELIPKRGRFSPEQIAEAIADADDEMYRNGIVVVGDIGNTADTFSQKEKSPIHYHSFVELLGLNPAYAQKIFDDGKKIMSLAKHHPASLVPHAPYSVSSALLELIAGDAGSSPVSIHNQESLTESEFSEKGTGDMKGFYEFLGIDIGFYQPSGKNSLHTHLPHLLKAPKILLVHNTFSSPEDISWAMQQHENIYWCFCPNANLYIENQLPAYENFRRYSSRITIGTDSYASNDQLSVLAELQVISKAAPQIPLSEILRWATLNGAVFLGLKQFGSFEKGKTPGINLISGYSMSNGMPVLSEKTSVKRFM